MKKQALLFLLTILTLSGQAQSGRLASYFVTEDSLSYALNFFADNNSYFVLISGSGKQISFRPEIPDKAGDYQYGYTGDIVATLRVKNPGREFPQKLKASFTLNGKNKRLVFRKDDKGIVD